jgi:hypothetical protein
MNEPLDLFPDTVPPADPPIGLTVQLVGAKNDHRHDRCGALAIVEPGKAMHAASLRCVTCGGFRGWLKHLEFNWLAAVAAKLGASDEPIILRNWNTTIGDDDMPITEQRELSGILFKNEDKAKENDRDYRGECKINGTPYWVSGWVKEGKRGKFLSLAFKLKDAPKTASTKAAAENFSDEIPF